MLYFFFLMIRRPPRSTLFPTRRSADLGVGRPEEGKSGKLRAHEAVFAANDPGIARPEQTIEFGLGKEGRSHGADAVPLSVDRCEKPCEPVARFSRSDENVPGFVGKCEIGRSSCREGV